MPRLIPIAISALLITGSVFAQAPELPIDLEPVRRRVKKLLQSPLPNDQAWGAYLVGDLNLNELGPDLIGFIEREGARGFNGDREFALRAAVDSMIRLNISPPAGLLDPFFETISYETIILITQKPRDYSGSLLKLAQSATRPSERFALLNLMTDGRTSGAAAWLLQDLEIAATLHITDPNNGAGVAGGSVGSIGGRCARQLGVPAGYPPFAIYDLSPDPWNGDVLLTRRAPKPIYYFRVAVITGAASPLHCEKDNALTTADRLEYIARLATRTARGLDLKQSYSGRVVPVEGDEVQLEAVKLRADIEADYYAAVRLLQERGTLTSSEAAGLRPMINLTVVDIRRDN